jgi:hypothetical protein
MKKLSLLFAVALATPAFAQTATPATDTSTTTTTTSTSTYPPCSAQVTDQCTETRWTHGHGHHYKGHRHHKK